MSVLLLILVFILSTLAGYKVISDVPSLLHTPLMSGMNALSGITVTGAVVATGLALAWSSELLGAVAVALAMINVVGGFVVTDRMLSMFRSKE